MLAKKNSKKIPPKTHSGHNGCALTGLAVELFFLPFMEESVNFSSAAELERIDGGAAAALDRALEVLLQLLDHPKQKSLLCYTNCAFSNLVFINVAAILAFTVWYFDISLFRV